MTELPTQGALRRVFPVHPVIASLDLGVGQVAVEPRNVVERARQPSRCKPERLHKRMQTLPRRENPTLRAALLRLRLRVVPNFIPGMLEAPAVEEGEGDAQVRRPP